MHRCISILMVGVDMSQLEARQSDIVYSDIVLSAN